MHAVFLEDLTETQGQKGKWFAAAKTAKYLDLALDCAAQPDAAPATLVRAARDFAVKDPAFAAQVGLHAIGHLLSGRGYDPNPLDIDAALGHVMAPSESLGKSGWALQALERLAGNAAADVMMSARLNSKLADIEKSRI